MVLYNVEIVGRKYILYYRIFIANQVHKTQRYCLEGNHQYSLHNLAKKWKLSKHSFTWVTIFFFNLKKGIVLFWLSSKLSTWSIWFTVRCCTKSGERRTKVLKECILNLIYLPFEVKIMWSIFFTSLTCKMIVFCAA